MRGDFKAIMVGRSNWYCCVCRRGLYMCRVGCRVRYSASAREEVINRHEQRRGEERRGVEDGGAVRLLDMVNGGWKDAGHG